MTQGEEAQDFNIRNFLNCQAKQKIKQAALCGTNTFWELCLKITEEDYPFRFARSSTLHPRQSEHSFEAC